jgi:hypothetical protein
MVSVRAPDTPVITTRWARAVVVVGLRQRRNCMAHRPLAEFCAREGGVCRCSAYFNGERVWACEPWLYYAVRLLSHCHGTVIDSDQDGAVRTTRDARHSMSLDAPGSWGRAIQLSNRMPEMLGQAVSVVMLELLDHGGLVLRQLPRSGNVFENMHIHSRDRLETRRRHLDNSFGNVESTDVTIV